MALPIDSYLPDIVAQHMGGQNLVLAAAPGAGKTTRVPHALWQAHVKAGGRGNIWVLEPRRLAARLAARHVAATVGEPVGQSVGYRVRFDDCTSAQTRLTYLTEGLLWRHLIADAVLGTVDCVVFDEFHGRSLASDLALAALRHVQQAVRPELRLVVMSATLDAGPIARLLGDAPIVTVPGRTHPVTVTYAANRARRPLHEQVAAAVAHICAPQATPVQGGDILVFLPGVAEIHRAEVACQGIAQRHGLAVLPLHGGLDAAGQDRAVRPMPQRKLILATNVAETSVTIDGVTWVIDSGLAKEASQDPWTGVARLMLRPISQAAGTQRAGRAGRTRPGHCMRLYTATDWARRPAQATPEIARGDLTEAGLWLAAMGLPPLGQLPCVDLPPADSCLAAHQLLVRLGAIRAPASNAPVDAPHGITALGQQLAQLSAHPRLGRLLLAADGLGIGRLGCRAAALLGDTAALAGLTQRARADAVGPSDLEPLLRDMSAWPREARAMAQQLEAQLPRVRHAREPGGPRPTSAAADTALTCALLLAFPDRVARRLPPYGVRPGTLALQLSSGGQAVLAATSLVRDSTFMVALYARDTEHSSRQQRVVLLAEAIDADLLLQHCSDAIVDSSSVTFNAQAQKVEAVSRLTYGSLTLMESRVRPDAAAAAPILAQAARALCASRGWSTFVDPQAQTTLLGRLETAAAQDPACAALQLDDAALDGTMAAACFGCLSLEELRQQPLLQQWLASCPAAAQAALQRLAPTQIRLANGRQLPVHYAPGQPPWISTWLQDFFGAAEGPRIAAGQLPVTLHLLAPNRRPVQVTQDLAGFWSRHYPSIRKELSRRYPRHAWPEDPRHAAAPPPSSRGRRPRT